MSRRTALPAIVVSSASASVVDVLTGTAPLVPPLPAGPLSAEDARTLTDRIRCVALEIGDRLARLRQLVDQAREGQAWSALGYASWTAYLADALEPMRLPREERREIVGYLSGQGMSSRAIAPVVSVDQKTVVADRAALAERAATEENPSPAAATVIVGRDGRTYTPRARLVVVPAPSEPASAREQLVMPSRAQTHTVLEYLRTRIATTGQATAEDWERAIAAAERYAVAAR